MTSFNQINLVSDGYVPAENIDPKLINPWGISYNLSNPAGPFWLSDNNSGVTTIYNGAGQPTAAAGQTVVTIATPPGQVTPASPTGQVRNTSTGFDVSNGTVTAPAIFIFATEDGTISGWNPTVNKTTSILAVDNSAGGTGAVYKGLAISTTAGGNFLYAANFRSGMVDMYDQNFKLLKSFTDSTIPSGYAPFNVQVLNGNLFVTYALQNGTKHDDVGGTGNGFVDEFDLNGNLVNRVASNGDLNSPWGLDIAPASFGQYAGDLLVGDFRSGYIDAYNLTNNSFVGRLQGADGQSIQINDLWALVNGNGGAGGSASSVYFTSGVQNEQHGLFGSLSVGSAAYSFQAVTYPGDKFVQLLGINNAGDIVGFHNATTSVGITTQIPENSTGGFTFGTENFPGAAQTQVVGINASGATAGIEVDSYGTTHGFTDIKGTFTAVDAPSTAFNQLLSISDNGYEAGYSSTDPTGATLQKAYVHNPDGSFTYVALPANVNSQATGINDPGTVVGFYMPTTTTSNGFYETKGGAVMTLQVPGSTFTQALGENNQGQIVGTYTDSAGLGHGFVYNTNSATFATVDVPNATATTVNGINEIGQLTGFFTDASGNTSGFVATQGGAAIADNPVDGATIIDPLGLTNLTVGGSNSVTVNNFQNAGATIFGNSGSDTLVTFIGGAVLAGGRGSNTLIANGSGNTLTAGDGQNTVVIAGFGKSNNVTVGNGGDDVNVFSDVDTISLGTGASNILLAITNGSTAHLGAGNAFVFGNSNKIIVDSLSGVISATGTSNQIVGGTGNEIVFAQSSTITLGNGNQLIGAGGSGNVITVGNGNSIIFAGSGGDTVTAGAGNDLFVLSGSGNTVTYGFGKDSFFGGSGGNTFIVPPQIGISSGNSADFYSFVAAPAGGDTLDVRAAFGGDTGLKSDLSNIGNYVSASSNGTDTFISAGSPSTALSLVATLHNVGNLSVATLLSDHAIRVM